MADGLVLFDHRLMILHPSVADSQAGVPELPLLFRCDLALRLGRLNHGFWIKWLAFGAVGMAALIQEELRQIQIPALAGGPIEFDQRQFHLLMPIHVVAFVRTEDPVDVVGKTLRAVEHLRLAGQLPMRPGHLEEVAGVVHLVFQAEIIPAFVEPVHDEE